MTPTPSVSRDDLTTALAIAEDLTKRAIWHEGRCTFHGATAPAMLGMPPRYISFGGDVYEGTAGVARFLALASVVGGGEAVRETAVGAIRHSLGRTDGWSLFAGGVGSGLVGLEIAELLHIPEIRSSAVEIIERSSRLALMESEASSAPADILVGVAGVIYGLLAARCYDPYDEWARRAALLGDHILAHARTTETGFSWPLMPGSEEHLCGLAHGAAGIAHVLDLLAGETQGGERFADAARRARSYEREWYDERYGSWADLRAEVVAATPDNLVYPHFWCHGSVGICADRMTAPAEDLFARSDAFAAFAGLRAEARRLVSGSCGPGAGDEINASQCHGLSGIADLLVDAWRIDGHFGHLVLARQLTAFMRNDAQRTDGWRSGVPGGNWAPGLMLGAAGMGWAHLRAALPSEVPSCWRLGSTLGATFVSHHDPLVWQDRDQLFPSFPSTV